CSNSPCSRTTATWTIDHSDLRKPIVREPGGPRRQLDLGAGTVVRAPEAIRADRSRDVKPDVVLDAQGGLPFPPGSLQRVFSFDLVEHLDDIPAIMTELHRILAPGGQVLITTPHFSCANSYTDPTHRHHFGWNSFSYFSVDHALSYYSTARFKISRRL